MDLFFIQIFFVCLMEDSKSCNFYVSKIRTKWEIECVIQMDKNKKWFENMGAKFIRGTCIGPIKMEEV